MVFPLHAEDSRQTFFTEQSETPYLASDLWTDIPNLTIDLTTEAGDLLFLSLTCYWWVVPDSTEPTYHSAVYYFAIDGIKVSTPVVSSVISNWTANFGDVIAYRYIASGVSPGPHNVTVQVQISENCNEGPFSAMHVLTAQILWYRFLFFFQFLILYFAPPIEVSSCKSWEIGKECVASEIILQGMLAGFNTIGFDLPAGLSDLRRKKRELAGYVLSFEGSKSDSEGAKQAESRGE